MSTETNPPIDIETLKNDIFKQEQLRDKFINEANNMFYLIVVSLISFICFLIMSKFIIASSFFVIGFLCLRKYNRAIGMAEIHNGFGKFLKMLLICEQTGDYSPFKAITQ